VIRSFGRLPLLVALLLGPGLGGAPVGPVAAASNDSLGLTATYQVNGHFSWANRSVAVETTVNVRNTTGGAVGSLVFNLTPLRLSNAVVGRATVDGQPATTTTNDQTVFVTLAPSLAVGASATVHIGYTATLNSNSSGNRWLFARTTVLTAYRWFPWLSRPINWEGSSDGDPWETAISSQVNVSLTTDRPLTIAATGQRTSISADRLTQAFVAYNVRDFNFSAAPDYRARSQTVSIAGASVKVTFYYRTLSPAPVMSWAIAALRDYSAKIARYTYPQLNIGEIDGKGDPIESPGHFWIPAGTSSRLLPWMVAHETGHQWFYAVVGNDQPGQPFADEAVVDFMARNLVNVWARSKCAQENLDQSVHEAGACYAWVIYVQGNLYLRAYRDYVGDATFWRGLANYYAAYRWKIGGTRQLLDALDVAAHVCYPHWLRFPSLYSTHC
jgi:hypothetical protein